jgi:type I restriction enzyme, S subunit
MKTVGRSSKENWKTVTLGEIATIERFAIQPEEISQGTVYLGLENIESGGIILSARPVDEGELASSKFKFTEHHVLYGKLRPYLAKIAMPEFTGICSTDILPILPSPELDRRFLCFFLRQPSMVAYANSLASGANLPRISPCALAAFQIPLPPLAEQRRIAEVLDQAEALRAKRRAALAQLDSLTQSIFLDLFGDPILNPKHWPDPTLGGLLTFQQYGPRFFNESYSPDGIRIVRITDLNEAGNLDFAGMPRMAVSEADRCKYVLKPGDIIFARTGATVGKVALIQPNDPPCIAGAYFITMRFKETVNPLYARAVLTAPSIRAIVAKRSRQAAQQNFSGPGLRQLPMPLPPIAAQLEFARRVNAVEKLKAAQRASLAELDALFASLQDRAFRGEL